MVAVRPRSQSSLVVVDYGHTTVYSLLSIERVRKIVAIRCPREQTFKNSDVFDNRCTVLFL